ncbi:MAG: SprT family zinc-dependent metalloprotease [Phycisphaeraceae bacterium]
MFEQPQTTVLVDCAGSRVPVAVQFRNRTRLSISVHPDGSVTALAPATRTLDQVAAHLERRRSWIAKQRRHFDKYQPLPDEKRYVAGETHLYLGRQYRLRIHEAQSASVKLVGRFFHVSVADKLDTRSISDAMDQWYRSHAEPIFHDRLDHCLEAAASLRSLPVQLRIRPMKRRWGSCSKAGTITLNTDLVKTPRHCIEYVIMHELCHLRVHDHSPTFYRLLGRCMPDWRERKKRLESVVLR